MISIVDPEDLKHILRPTVYAVTVGSLPPAYTRDRPATENGRDGAGTELRGNPPGRPVSA